MRLGCAFAIQNAKMVELEDEICHLILYPSHGTTLNCQRLWLGLPDSIDELRFNFNRQFISIYKADFVPVAQRLTVPMAAWRSRRGCQIREAGQICPASFRCVCESSMVDQLIRGSLTRPRSRRPPTHLAPYAARPAPACYRARLSMFAHLLNARVPFRH